MLVWVDSEEAHQPCGIQTCRICGRGFYCYPNPQSHLDHVFCFACLTGDCPSIGGTRPAKKLRNIIFDSVNRRVFLDA